MMINLDNVTTSKLEDLFYDLQCVPALLDSMRFYLVDADLDNKKNLLDDLDLLCFMLDSLANYFKIIQPVITRYYFIEHDMESALESKSNSSENVG